MAPLRVRVASVRGVDFVDISDRAAQRSAAAIVGAAVADFVRQHPTFDVHPAEQALYITFNKLDPGKPLSAYFDEGRAGVLEARSGLDELHLVRTGDGKCHLVEDYHQPRFRIPLSTPPEVLDDLVSLSAAGSMPFELRLQAKEMTREEMVLRARQTITDDEEGSFTIKLSIREEKAPETVARTEDLAVSPSLSVRELRWLVDDLKPFDTLGFVRLKVDGSVLSDDKMIRDLGLSKGSELVVEHAGIQIVIFP